MREYLEKVFKADQCAQNFDDIGIAANSAPLLIRNIRAHFECIRKAGLKLTIEKCHFVVTEVEFLERTITPQGIPPQDHKFEHFWQMFNSQNRRNKYNDTTDSIRQLLPKLHTRITRILQTIKSRQIDQSNRRITRQPQSEQPNASRRKQLGPQTTNHRTPIRPHDRRQLSRLRLRAND